MVDLAKDSILVFFTFSYACSEVVVDCAEEQLLVILDCNQAKVLVIFHNHTRITLSIKEHSIREYKLTTLNKLRVWWQKLFHQPKKLSFTRLLDFVLSDKIIDEMYLKSILICSYFFESNVARLASLNKTFETAFS